MHTLKIVSLNLWEGGKLLPGILDFLRQQQPDLLLLQEVYNSADASTEPRFHSMNNLQPVLGLSFHVFAPALLDTSKGQDTFTFESGNAIFSRFPIVGHEVFPFGPAFGVRTGHSREEIRRTPRNLHRATLDINGTEVHVGNFQGVWDLDGENDSPDRLGMSRVIVDAIRGKRNVILGGDTNVRPNTQTIRNIEEHLVNIFKKEIAAGELRTTFNMRRKTNPETRAGFATSVVDMLFVSPNIEVVEHSCPSVDISDHLPLVATLQIPS